MAVDEDERMRVKRLVQSYIDTLRETMAMASDSSDDEDIPINRSFIEMVVKFIIHSCQLVINDDRFREWLTQITGTTSEGNDIFFTNDEELAHSMSRVSDLRSAIYDSMKNGGMKTVLNSL